MPRKLILPGPPIAPKGYRWVNLNEFVVPGDYCRDLEGNWFVIPRHPPRPLSKPITPFLYIRRKIRAPRKDSTSTTPKLNVE